MPKGSKSISAAAGHRTKAEIAARTQAEQDMLSGKKLAEFPAVKGDPVAHAEYRRVSALMKAIGKDDALYSAAVNRYAELRGEIAQLQQDAARYRALMDSLQRKFDESDPDSEEITAFAKAYSGMLSQINKLDDKIMQKRRMMGDIEKENCMTVQAALRSIPKEAGKKEENPLAAILGGG